MFDKEDKEARDAQITQDHYDSLESESLMEQAKKCTKYYVFGNLMDKEGPDSVEFTEDDFEISYVSRNNVRYYFHSDCESEYWITQEQRDIQFWKEDTSLNLSDKTWLSVYAEHMAHELL